jgi:acyl-CoA reductase-like NAD-dependent aldehyde dehydrogenase
VSSGALVRMHYCMHKCAQIESCPFAPFGSFKDSVYGKQGGVESLLEFVRIKNVNLRLG